MSENCTGKCQPSYVGIWKKYKRFRDRGEVPEKWGKVKGESQGTIYICEMNLILDKKKHKAG